MKGVSQRKVFLKAEGDAYFIRKIKKNDGIALNRGKRVIDAINELEITPKKILEIGCCDGQRLFKLREVYQADVYGIDPSQKAIYEGRKKHFGVNAEVGTADDLPYGDADFDLIIIGFCAYLFDRDDLFKIAYEVDRCLQNGGMLLIEDFYPPWPCKLKYKYHKDVFTYKMDYSKMFLWNPIYTEVLKKIYLLQNFSELHNKIGIIVLKKDPQYAYVEEKQCII